MDEEPHGRCTVPQEPQEIVAEPGSVARGEALREMDVEETRMKMQQSLLYKKIHGCLLGGAIGNAMGSPVENLSYQQIEEDHGRIETLLDMDGEVPAEELGGD